jgi:16S rRNA (cytosine967-C5)-methyltransferase
VESILEKALATTNLSPQDRNLIRELVFGAVRWQATLDWLIARKSRHPQQPPHLQNLLRLGLYQIFWLDRIPNHAAVNETVEAAKRGGFGPRAGFVNALLRGYLREVEATREALSALQTRQPALGYSHPEWLVARWQQRWGSEKTRRLLQWNNTPPETFARLNALKTNATKLIDQWREEGVDYDFLRRDWFEENLVFKLRSHPPLARLPSFQQGLFYVQDPGTLLAVSELHPRPGEDLLDFCAAPGGKTCYAAQLMNNQGRITAHDLCPDRLDLVRENCARLGVTCVQTLPPPTPPPQDNPRQNPEKPPLKSAAPIMSAAFDKILLDAPCSNSGVMRRRVDLRWRIRPEEIDRLQAAQGRLLAQAAALLKPGGTLVYSTCSLEPEENQHVIRTFLDGNSGFRLVRERQLSPFENAVDGAYVAALIRA